MKRAKITIIGAGHVGETCAQYAASKALGDVVLVDVIEGMPQGKALDLCQAAPVEGYDVSLVGTNSYQDTTGSDVVIITSGIPRGPGMSRDELIETNVKIVADVTAKVVERSPDAVLIVVTNPLDAMVYTAWKISGFPTQRVVGQAGILDIARFCAFIAMEIGCSVKDVHALLMGGHGDTMVPLPRYSSVCGIPVTQLIPAGKLDEIVTRTRNGGAEIVGLLKTGSAYYAPSTATISMAQSILRDERRILPCAAYCDKEYGVGGYFVGVPCVLGAGGVEKVIEVDLDEKERQMFNHSVEHVKKLSATTEKLLAK
ncbi:MAG: malate dehydrogenase [Phycisphaerae bacterium]